MAGHHPITMVPSLLITHNIHNHLLGHTYRYGSPQLFTISKSLPTALLMQIH